MLLIVLIDPIDLLELRNILIINYLRMFTLAGYLLKATF